MAEYIIHNYMETKQMKFTKDNVQHLLKVGLYLAGSAAGSALLQFLMQVDFGEWNWLVMGVLNLIAVGVKELGRSDR